MPPYLEIATFFEIRTVEGRSPDKQIPTAYWAFPNDRRKGYITILCSCQICGEPATVFVEEAVKNISRTFAEIFRLWWRYKPVANEIWDVEMTGRIDFQTILTSIAESGHNNLPTTVRTDSIDRFPFGFNDITFAFLNDKASLIGEPLLVTEGQLVCPSCLYQLADYIVRQVHAVRTEWK